MPRKIDLTGQKFGKLTVIKEDEPYYTSGGNKQIKWICECECGNFISVTSSNLRNGNTESCGCIRLPNLAGKRFGKLTAISNCGKKGTLHYYTCQCDCGNIVDVRASQLIRGIVKSCGCLRKIPNKFDDLTGQRFGNLTVLERIGTKWKSPYWKCKCDCGNYTNATSANLRSGNVKSCGCKIVESATTHGLSKTRIYKIYFGIKSRCYNESYHAYPDYGGRGIKMCDEWLGENGFENFYNWSMLNGYAENLTLDREDNNGGYSPDNCRWTTQKEQTRNKRNNLLIEYKGKTKTLVEWSEILNIPYDILNNRITGLKWDIEKAFTQPIKRRSKGSS